jgi:hypothetical protein
MLALFNKIRADFGLPALTGMPVIEYDSEGFNQYGFDRDGFDENGFDVYGYDENGRDADGE